MAKLNATGSDLVFSTFLGGSGLDLGNDIAVDDSSWAHVTGEARSSDYPITRVAFDTSYSNFDTFVVKLNTMGSVLD